VYCIDTGEIFASAIDAANANGVCPSPMSTHLVGKTKTCNGKRFCYVSKMMEHLEEITEANRIRAAKVAAYDAETEHRNSIIKAQNNVDRYEVKAAELRRELEETLDLLSKAKLELHRLKNDD
jgi:predicted  nucleic acid-binding Zn-ribbon protein